MNCPSLYRWNIIGTTSSRGKNSWYKHCIVHQLCCPNATPLYISVLIIRVQPHQKFHALLILTRNDQRVAGSVRPVSRVRMRMLDHEAMQVKQAAAPRYTNEFKEFIALIGDGAPELSWPSAVSLLVLFPLYWPINEPSSLNCPSPPSP